MVDEIIEMIKNEIAEDKEVICWDEFLETEIARKEYMINKLKDIQKELEKDIW